MQNSGSKKQSTLFQSWGKTKPQNDKKQPPSQTEDFVEINDSDDEDLYKAIELSKLEFDLQQQQYLSEIKQQNNTNALCQPSTSTSYQHLPRDDNKVNLPGFDLDAGRTWIYPTNYSHRKYQYDIVEKALYTNTMVVLPTGLGKTFIAAVIMYNFYRWYPQGKIIFMAPTKPLVSQQIEACFSIMGIPKEDTETMTGSMAPEKRRNSWASKRVFFLTPQVLTNDLSRGICSAKSIRCLIVDEAHKAQGNYAYCQVVKELSNYTDQFRIVALSATPGSDKKAVEQVLKNLLISTVEQRSEESPDIKEYTHARNIEKVVVPLGQELQSIISSFVKVMSVYVDRLVSRGALRYQNPATLPKFTVLKEKEKFVQNPPGNMSKALFGCVQADFFTLISLCHAYELLQLHGMRSFYRFIKSFVNGEKNVPNRNELLQNEDFDSIYNNLNEKFHNISFSGNSLNTSRISQLWNNKEPPNPSEPFVYGHPKLKKLEEIVVQHFEKCKSERGNDGYKDTRVMIFSQYRDSVEEINEMLKNCRPLVRAMTFVGQGTANGTCKGLTQKKQMKVIQAFKSGGFNTLISTSVGEEGLDIGEVDLIICYDAPKSPIRLVQRMGRTGRKREGRIVVLLAQGKEEGMYRQSLSNKRFIQNAKLYAQICDTLNVQSPRMIPIQLIPLCHKVHITLQNYREEAKGTRKLSTTTTTKKNDSRKVGRLKKDDILSPDEFDHWKNHLKLPQEQVATLKSSRFLYLKKPGEGNETEGSSTRLARGKDGPHLSLSNWIPWQACLQTAHHSGHSHRTNMFVNLMQFSQAQVYIPENEDPYGHEMSANLLQTDILQPGEKDIYANENITSYFKPTVKPKSKTTDDVKKRSALKRKGSDKEEEGTSKKKSKREEESSNRLVSVREKMQQGRPWIVIDDDDDFVTDHAEVKGHVSHEENGTTTEKDDIAGDPSCSDMIQDHVIEKKRFSSFLLIKPPPIDQDCELHRTETVSSSTIKAIALDNLYVPDSEYYLHEYDEEIEFYEKANEECKQSEKTSRRSSLSSGFDTEDELILSGIPEELLEEVGVIESHARLPKVEDLVEKSMSPVKKINHDSPVESPKKTEDEVDDDFGDFDSDCEIIFSQLDNKSLENCDITSKKDVDVGNTVSPPGVTEVQSPNHLEPHNVYSLKTSTPKSSMRSSMLTVLPSDSPIVIQKRVLNQKPKVSTETLFTPVKKLVTQIQTSKNGSVPLDTNVNISSVLFNDTSSFQPESVHKSANLVNKSTKVHDEFSNSSLPNTKSQDLLTVTQMVSLLNKSHKEKCMPSSNPETLKTPVSCRQLNHHDEKTADVPFFDLGFDLACFDEAFDDCDIPNSAISQKGASGSTCTKEVGKVPSSANSKHKTQTDQNTNICDNKQTVKSKNENIGGSLSSFKFGIDFGAFNEPTDGDDVDNNFLERPTTSKSSMWGNKSELNSAAKTSGDLRTPIKPNCTNMVNTNSRRSETSSDGEVVHPPVRRRLNVLNDDCSNSSGVFESPVKRPQQERKKKKPPRRRQEDGKCQFVQEEAELSGWASSDDEDTSMDCYDDSFVNDQESHAHNVSTQDDVDMQAVYLRTVRSPVPVHLSKFKLQYGVNSRINVFSQSVRETAESYIEDSFCVNNDEVEYMDSTENEQESPQAELDHRGSEFQGNRREKRRIRVIETSSEEERSPAKSNRMSFQISPSTSGIKTNSSSSAFTHLKSPPSTKMLPPLARFEKSCERSTVTSPKINKLSSSASQDNRAQDLEKAKQSTVVQKLFPLNNKEIKNKTDDPFCTIFVDSRELAGGQGVISLLRKQHSVDVSAERLAGEADYQVGTQVGVLRMSAKNLSQMQKKPKTIEMIQAMLDFYDKPYLIIEKDKSSNEMFRSRCLDAILYSLLPTDVNVLYSAGIEETAKLLSDLCQSEMTRGNGIHKRQCNTPFFQFYTSLPHVNTAVALNFCKNFRNIKLFLSSSPSDIEGLGCISRKQAKKIHDFVHSVFL